MMHLVNFILVVLLASTSLAADGKAVYARYRQLIDDQTKPEIERVQKGQEYLRSLQSDEFLGFIREFSAVLKVSDKDEAGLYAMAVFAQSYMIGPGRNESGQDSLRLILDPSLPNAWKIGLLDVLNFEKRSDLSETEVVEFLSLLMKKGQSNDETEMFRHFCLRKLGSFLASQQEIIMKNDSTVKDALVKQDRTLLPKKNDASVKQAAKLLDAIRDYKVALRKTADEVQDEKIKNNLKARLAKWETSSAPHPK